MRFLHTSDWHLGQRFITQSREQEQQMALDWLLEVIQTEQVDALLVSGDIFDVGNPPLVAEEMYYTFLTRLKNTCCRHVVITGGNHDSPSRLNAPKGILRALDMHVVGAAGGPEEEIIQLKDPEGNLRATVLAVPFLRERDFRVTTSGESADERIERIQAGIIAHYQELAEAVADEKGIVIAMGHLYAKGASTHAEQENIYLGNLDNIAANQFPERFDYIALGHIHRMQKVGKQSRIRYCGSLIPLSFSEISDKKGVFIVDLEEGKGLVEVREVIAPVFRRLITLKGTLEELEQKLLKAHRPEDPLPAWLELVVTGDPGVTAPDRHLRDLAAGLHLDILKIKIDRQAMALSEQAPAEDLSTLTVEEVFLQRCASRGLNEAEINILKQEFYELQEWMRNAENAL